MTYYTFKEVLEKFKIVAQQKMFVKLDDYEEKQAGAELCQAQSLV